MLQILSILAVTTLHDLVKSCKRLGKIMHGLILPRCFAMTVLPRLFKIMQDHARQYLNIAGQNMYIFTKVYMFVTLKKIFYDNTS